MAIITFINHSDGERARRDGEYPSYDPESYDDFDDVDNERDEDDKVTTVACAYPRCGKMPAPNSAYCPHHEAVVEWEAGAPERKQRRAAESRERRRSEEEYLAASPLRAVNSQPVKPPQHKRDNRKVMPLSGEGGCDE
jgi:hypothetical protein